MRRTILIISFLLVLTLLLSNCNIPPNNENNTTDNQTENTNESSNTAETEIDEFEAVRENKEAWLSYGLSAYESEKKPENLKKFFTDRANMTYLTLYDHMFEYDSEKSIPVAEALFKFICDEYGKDALTDTEKRIEYKSAYLRSLGLDMEYAQTAEVEEFFISMDFSKTATYQYVMSFDNVTYYFKDFSVGSPAQYHAFLYHNTTGLWKLVQYLKTNNLNTGLDTDRQFNFYMNFNDSGFSETKYDTGNMYINDSYSALHEAVHAIGITQKDNIWLSEGICNYFGKMLGFNSQIAAASIQILTKVKQGYFDDRANAGDISAITYKTVYERYTEAGGKLDSVDNFDLFLYNNITVKIELNTNQYTTLADRYKIINGKECSSVGEELSYEQATSLVAYLAEIYGIEAVMQAYQTQDIEKTFGKNYESLKADWISYLELRAR